MFNLNIQIFFVIAITTTAQKMKFSIKDIFTKCGQIRRKLRIWSHLLKKYLMEYFIFCAVKYHAIHQGRDSIKTNTTSLSQA